MRRKPLIVIGIVAGLACGIFGLSACHKEEPEPHTHAWGEWETVTAATCTAEGTEERSCLCGEHETRSVEKLPHTPTENIVIEPTCINEGYSTGSKCAVCNTELHGGETIPALGHSFGEWKTIKESTCTDAGLEQRTCTRENCGAVEDNVLGLKPHTLVPIGEYEEPTCTEIGWTEGQKCSECQHVIEERQPIDPLGHEMQSPQHFQDEDGVDHHKGYCSRCEQNITVEQCVFTVVKTAATCTKAEHHVHTCPTCGYEYEHDEGSPLGHNFGDWHFDVATYDASLRDRDGAATVVRQHIRTCSNPGHEADPAFPEVAECNQEEVDEVAATCISSGYTNYKCTECENTYTGDRVNALGHDWAKNEDGSIIYTHETYQGMEVHYRTCTRENCDRPNGKDTYYACYYTSSTREKATCTKGATIIRVCDYCKYRAEEEIGAPLGHAYGAWTHDDETSGETSKHFRVCGREECGNREEGDCKDSMKDSGYLPTCQYEGKDIKVCEKCRYTQDSGALPKLQHDVTGQPYIADHAQRSHYQVCKRAGCNERVYEECPYTTSVKAMTCTTDEETTYTCPTCHDTFTEVTAKSKGHRVTQYDESDQFYHKGRCDECKEVVSVAHDFSESNICTVCHRDGLSYTFETGSGNTRARVSRSVKNGVYYYINAKKLIIPATVNIDGKGEVPVVGIGTDAFFGNTFIEEVELPLSLEYIGYNAFQGCSKLSNVHFTGHEAGAQNVSDCKLNRIESGAFKGCVSLTNAILPATLQYIGAEAFRGCTLLDEIDIPDLVTEIEDHAFTDTKYFLTEKNWEPDGVLYIENHLIRAKTSLSGTYKVNDNVVSISAEAFKDCVFLQEIELPATLKAVDRDAFKGCTALTTVVFEGTFEQYLGIRFDNNEASPMHVATDLTFKGESGALTIPDEATVIPAGAFKGSDVQSIVIPASVTSIGANAFADCENLTSVTFATGSQIISIGENVVANTPFYTAETNWTNGLLYIKDEAETPIALVAVDKERVTTTFEESYKQVEIASGTIVVAPRAFANFTELRYVVVPETVLFLGEGVFSGCNLSRVNFRGTGKAWFCYSPQLGRVYTDAAVYGGAENEDTAKQVYAAGLFKLYTLQWKRGNYGSGN